MWYGAEVERRPLACLLGLRGETAVRGRSGRCAIICAMGRGSACDGWYLVPTTISVGGDG